MEATAWRHGDDEAARMIDQLPAHVVAVLDHLTLIERDGVLAAISAFSRHDREGTTIPGPEPLYLLWAAPEMRVIVRRVASEGPPRGRSR